MSTTEIILAVIGVILGASGWSATRQLWLKTFISRLVVEVRAVVLEVKQSHVDGVKAGKDPRSPEGATLTKAEAKVAMDMALATLKSNLGAKGLRRLARVLGLEDTDAYLRTHLEGGVGEIAIEQAASKPVELKLPAEPPPPVRFPL